LVILGVSGELVCTFRSFRVESEIRTTTSKIENVLKAEVGIAGTSAIDAARASDRANLSAKQARDTAGNAKTLASGAEAQVTDAESRVSALNMRIKELEPRRLTEEQIGKMSNFLSKHRTTLKLEIIADWGVWDAGPLGRQIHDVFRASGWDVGPGIGFGQYSGNPKGIWITSGGSEDSRAWSIVVRDAFHEAGIAVPLELDKNAMTQPTSKITLNIGCK
jgi:hypothetical protein